MRPEMIAKKGELLVAIVIAALINYLVPYLLHSFSTCSSSGLVVLWWKCAENLPVMVPRLIPPPYVTFNHESLRN